MAVGCAALMVAVAGWFWRPLVAFMAVQASPLAFSIGLLLATLEVALAWTRDSTRSRGRRWWQAAMRVLGVLSMVTLIVLLTGGLRVHEPMGRRENPERGSTVSLLGHSFMQWHTGAGATMRPEIGLSVVYPIVMPPAWVRCFWTGHDNARNQTSLTAITEDGHPLPIAHAHHAAIRTLGNGRFSHWGAVGGSTGSHVYFSSLDGTSPLENCRRYVVAYRLVPRLWLVLCLVAFCLPGLTRMARFARSFGEAFRAPVGRWWIEASMIAAGLSCFVFALTERWRLATTTGAAVGGLLPWSDASNHFSGGMWLLQGHPLHSTAERRPLYAFFLAALLGPDRTLETTLILQATLVGLACVLAGRQVWAVLGGAAGFAAFGILAAAEQGRFIHTTLSETLGLTLGATAFTVMCRGVVATEAHRYALGLGLLALAVAVRPGPVLILPALVVFPILVPGRTWKAALRHAALGGCAVSMAFALNLAVFKIYGKGTVYPAGNFAYTLYGLVKGGEPWQSFRQDHPGLSERDAVSLAYRESWERFRERPADLARGLWKFGRLYAEHSLGWLPDPFVSMARGLAVVGLLAAWVRRREPLMSWLLLAGVSILASAPWIFWAPDALRAFVPTAPFEGALVGLGLATLVRVLSFATSSAAKRTTTVGGIGPEAFALILAALVSIVPAMAIALSSRPKVALPACDAGHEPVVIRLGNGSPYLRVEASTSKENWAPEVDVSEFRRDPEFPGIQIGPFLRGATAGDLLIQGHDLSRQRLWWIRARANEMPRVGAYYAVCARPAEPPSPYFTVTATSVREVTPLP